MQEPGCPRISVVIATFNRVESLERLLKSLGDQTLPPDQYEVVVVDDGSRVPVRPALENLAVPYALRIEEQRNAGAAVARQRAAKLARGEILVILDDDMQVGRGFVEAHLRGHPDGTRRAVMGVMRRTDDFARAPLYHRWHQTRLEQFYAAARAGRPVHGWNLCTGNLSVRREDFFACGGFDPSLGQSEDAELGMRLERFGVSFAVSDDAWSLNASDHRSVARWRKGAEGYGATDVRIGRMHPGLREASPWRYLAKVNPILPPIIVGAALVPPVSRLLGGVTYALGAALGRAGLDGPAFTGATLTYGIDYLRGVRGELGSARALLADIARYAAGTATAPGGSRRARALRAFVDNVRADHAQLRAYDAKYKSGSMAGRFAPDVIRKVGLQMMLWIRLMHLFRDAGLSLAAQATSRTIRHLYASDINWDAEFAPGVVIAHGFAIAIARGVKIGPGCILCHNVSIGLGKDDEGKDGAPTLEANVHVGPGSILLGPLTVGEGSKLMAGAILRHSVPARSLVVSPEAEVQRRAQRAPVSAA